MTQQLNEYSALGLRDTKKKMYDGVITFKSFNILFRKKRSTNRNLNINAKLHIVSAE